MNRITSETGLWLLEEDEVANALLRNGIANHLNSMNYEVTLLNGRYSASHPIEYSFDYRFFQKDTATFWMFFDGQKQERVPEKDFYEFVNALNAATFISSFSITQEGDVFSRMTYIGGFDKTHFAKTLEFWDMDIRNLLRQQDVRNFVRLP